MKNAKEVGECVAEAEFHLQSGSFATVEEFNRCVSLNLRLIEILPKVAKATWPLYTVSRGEGVSFAKKIAEELFFLLTEKPLRLMAEYAGARFNPWLELCLDACRNSPYASTMMFNAALVGQGAPRQHTAYDMAKALNELVEYMAMGYKSQVFKDRLRKWDARCLGISKRVEVFIDRLACKEPFMEMSSFCLVAPTVFALGDQANHVSSLREDLMANLRTRLSQVARGVVLNARIAPEGTRFDMLLVGRSVSNFHTESYVRDAWGQVTQGRGQCYRLDGDGSQFAYRSMSASRHLPTSEQRRRFGLYFGMCTWLVHWECLGAGALAMLEFEASAARWPFPVQRAQGYVPGSLSSDFSRLYGQ